MIKLKQLVFLKKAIEIGNITGAAEQLNVAQTALGIQIRNLEYDMGVKLLERHSRGVTPTPAGELLNKHTDEILVKVEEARRAVKALAGHKARPISLGLTPSIIRLVGDDIIMDIAKNAPGVSLRIVEDFSFVLMKLLGQGELDCALSYSPDVEPNMERIALLEEDLFYLTSPDAKGEEGPISFRNVIEGDLAMTGREDAVFKLVSQNAERLGLKLNVAYEVQSIRAVKNLVAKNVAATIMPFGAAEGELRKGKLIARPIVAPSVTRTLMFVYPKEKASTVATDSVIDLMRSISELLYQTEGPIMRRL